MAPRSKVLTLPDDVRRALDERLVAAGFGGYEALAEWLQTQGFEISRSAVHRYGQAFEARLGALRLASEQARAIVAEVGDDAGELGEALTMVAQQKTFDLLVDLEVDGGKVAYDKLISATAKLNAAAVQQKRWRQDVRQRVERAAREVEQIARAGGLSDALAEQIRAKMLGVAE